MVTRRISAAKRPRSFADFANEYGGLNREEFRQRLTGPFLLYNLGDGREAEIFDAGAYLGGEGGSVIIGREGTCDLILLEKSISRVHACINFDGQSWSITDLKSSNGTHMTDELVPMKVHLLGSGMYFRVGKVVKVMFLQADELYPLVFTKAKEVEESARPVEPIAQKSDTIVEEMTATAGGLNHYDSAVGHLLPEIQSMSRADFEQSFPHPTMVGLPATAQKRLDAGVALTELLPQLTAEELEEMRIWPLDPKNVDRGHLIGRAPNNDIIIEQRLISRVHAWVYCNDGHWMVGDLRSSNGTFLNGKRLVGDVELSNESIIRLGECMLWFLTPQSLWRLLQTFPEAHGISS